MKIQKYICDRCKKEFDVREGSKHDQIIIKPHYPNDPDETRDLCFDCSSSLDFFFEYHKLFDELADNISKKLEIGEQ